MGALTTQARNPMGKLSLALPPPQKKKRGNQLNFLNFREEKSGTPTPEVDDEGYNVRPKSDTWDNDKASFYSSSDTDSGEKITEPLQVSGIRLGDR